MNVSYMKSVAKSGLFKYLDEKSQQQAWDELKMSPCNYSDGEIIYHQEETIRRAAIVHRGTIRGERIRAEGTSNLAYVYRKSEVFAFEAAISSKHTSPLQFTAQGNVTAIFFDVQSIFASTFQRPLVTGLMELIANDDIKKLYRIEILSRRSIRGRVLAHLKFMASRNGSNSFKLDMTREQLAQYLCVNRSALSNELSNMKREGIIDFERNCFTLLEKKWK